MGMRQETHPARPSAVAGPSHAGKGLNGRIEQLRQIDEALPSMGRAGEAQRAGWVSSLTETSLCE